MNPEKFGMEEFNETQPEETIPETLEPVVEKKPEVKKRSKLGGLAKAILAAGMLAAASDKAEAAPQEKTKTEANAKKETSADREKKRLAAEKKMREEAKKYKGDGTDSVETIRGVQQTSTLGYPSQEQRKAGYKPWWEKKPGE